MSDFRALDCTSVHRSTGTIGYPVPGTPEWPEGTPLPMNCSHASVMVCDLGECQDRARRHIRRLTGHDGIYTSFADARSRAERLHTPKGIQRKRTKGWRMPDGAVYVGRPSKWGNPFTVAGAIEAGYDLPDAELRQMCVDAYRSVIQYGKRSEYWFVGAAKLLTVAKDARRELAGKDLVCWCPTNGACHRDVLLEYANRSLKVVA